MFALKDLRAHVTSKLDADIGVLKKHRNPHLTMTVKVEPLSLNTMRIPVLLFENPNVPISTNFELDFESIIKKVQAI